jgi:hypothetical protein
MKPEALWVTRPQFEHGQFALKTFTERIHQELHSRRERVHWLLKDTKKKQNKARGEKDDISDRFWKWRHWWWGASGEKESPLSEAECTVAPWINNCNPNQA